MNHIIIKKCIAVVLFFTLSSFLLLPPLVVKATPIIEDTELAAIAAATAVDATANTGGWIVRSADWAWENFIKPVAISIIKKRILDVMVDQTVQWIQNGETPRFVSNFGGLIEDAGQAAVGDIAQEVGLASICSPFKLRLQLQIPKVQPLSQKVSCTLDKIVGNFQQFADNFQTGGWIGYQELMKPQNNRWGAELLVQNELIERKAKETEAAKQEAQTGQGFLSQKRCMEWTHTYKDSNGGTKTYAWENGNFSVASADGKETYTSYPTPSDGKLTALSYQDTDEVSPISDKCTNDEIITPGRSIGDSFSHVLKTDFEYINSNQELAKTIADYTAVIADAAINRIAKESISGIKDIFKKNSNSSERGQSGYTLPNNVQDTINDFENSKRTNIRNSNGKSIDSNLTKISTNLTNTSSTLQNATSSNYQLILTLDNPNSTDDLIGCLQAHPLKGSLTDAQTLLTEAQTNTYITLTGLDERWNMASNTWNASKSEQELLITDNTIPISDLSDRFNDLSTDVSSLEGNVSRLNSDANLINAEVVPGIRGKLKKAQADLQTCKNP